MIKKIVDVMAAAVVTVGSPLFRPVGNWPGNFPLYLRQADKVGVQWRSTHYYHPTYANADLPQDVTVVRSLPGLDLNEAAQLSLLQSFNVQEELASLAEGVDPESVLDDDNPNYNVGDVDALYAMVRHLKPRRLFEIGSGYSTRVAAKAIARNVTENKQYGCRHVCIEPYEMPWLEKLGPEILRKRAEDVPAEFFDVLGAGDILFIDSSHVIRPFGDVLFEFQEVFPRLANGVVVHLHDIFTPRDYPERWLRDERRLWNEQYLLEVMLANSSRYKTVLALNWLCHTHRRALDQAFPKMREKPNANPGAFWFAVGDQ